MGWCAGIMMGANRGKAIIESVLVGVFGAAIGGEAIASIVSGAVAADAPFHMRSLVFAALGAAALLLLLWLMRRSIATPTARSRKGRGRR